VLAVVPAVAQALTPHYYSSGVRISEDDKVPILEWGQLTIDPCEPNGLCAEVTCEDSAGGFIENPVGGGNGKAQTTRFSTWNCSDAECPPGEVEIKGQKYEKQFEIIAPPHDLPWPSSLINTTAPFRTNSTGVVLTLGCYAHKLTRSEAETGKATGPGENEEYPLAPPGVCETNATHLWEPEDRNGTNQGNNQSRLSFNQPAGTGLSCANGFFTGRVSGSLKEMGYEGSELITVKNS
jgi:hypothetical protein